MLNQITQIAEKPSTTPSVPRNRLSITRLAMMSTLASWLTLASCNPMGCNDNDAPQVVEIEPENVESEIALASQAIDETPSIEDLSLEEVVENIRRIVTDLYVIDDDYRDLLPQFSAEWSALKDKARDHLVTRISVAIAGLTLIPYEDFEKYRALIHDLSLSIRAAHRVLELDTEPWINALRTYEANFIEQTAENLTVDNIFQAIIDGGTSHTFDYTLEEPLDDDQLVDSVVRAITGGINHAEGWRDYNGTQVRNRVAAILDEMNDDGKRELLVALVAFSNANGGEDSTPLVRRSRIENLMRDHREQSDPMRRFWGLAGALEAIEAHHGISNRHFEESIIILGRLEYIELEEDPDHFGGYSFEYTDKFNNLSARQRNILYWILETKTPIINIQGQQLDFSGVSEGNLQFRSIYEQLEAITGTEVPDNSNPEFFVNLGLSEDHADILASPWLRRQINETTTALKEEFNLDTYWGTYEFGGLEGTRIPTIAPPTLRGTLRTLSHFLEGVKLWPPELIQPVIEGIYKLRVSEDIAAHSFGRGGTTWAHGLVGTEFRAELESLRTTIDGEGDREGRPARRTMVINSVRGENETSEAMNTMHHELFHILQGERLLDESSWPECEYIELYPGFQRDYGRQPTGYASTFAMENRREDQAHLFGRMMVRESYIAITQRAEQEATSGNDLLARKITSMKQMLLEATNGEWNEDFWSALENGTLGPEFWQN